MNIVRDFRTTEKRLKVLKIPVEMVSILLYGLFIGGKGFTIDGSMPKDTKLVQSYTDGKSGDVYMILSNPDWLEVPGGMEIPLVSHGTFKLVELTRQNPSVDLGY